MISDELTALLSEISKGLGKLDERSAQNAVNIGKLMTAVQDSHDAEFLARSYSKTVSESLLALSKRLDAVEGPVKQWSDLRGNAKWLMAFAVTICGLGLWILGVFNAIFEFFRHLKGPL